MFSASIFPEYLAYRIAITLDLPVMCDRSSVTVVVVVSSGIDKSVSPTAAVVAVVRAFVCHQSGRTHDASSHLMIPPPACANLEYA